MGILLKKTVKCLLLIRILPGPQNGTNPMVDIYPQMGSKHNINMIFERFSASRVGLKQIPMKNSHGNSFFIPNKKTTPARIWAVKLTLDSFKVVHPVPGDDLNPENRGRDDLKFGAFRGDLRGFGAVYKRNLKIPL